MAIQVTMPYQLYEELKDTLQELMSSFIMLQENHQKDSISALNDCFGDIETTRDSLANLYAQLLSQEGTPSNNDDILKEILEKTKRKQL